MDFLFQRIYILPLVGLGVIIVGILLGTFLVVSRKKSGGVTIPQPNKQVIQKLKSVRIDLSAMDKPANSDELKNSIVSKLKDVGANTVFLSPWADGKANYKSSLMRESLWGNNSFVESFIAQAHAQGIKVYAWFVIGKDNFDPEAHPEWFSETVEGKRYYHNDEPGVEIPVASLANAEYVTYNLKSLKEISALPFDGWVLSEPIMSWGDKTETTYADFSKPMTQAFKQQTGIDPKELFNKHSNYYYENNKSLYDAWVTLRATTVTQFMKKSIDEIRTDSPQKPIVITLYTEPNSDGTLVPFSTPREWLGEDISALASLKPDYFEIQDLFYNFDNTQDPSWVNVMVPEFKNQLAQAGYSIPIMVSIQGFDGQKKLTPAAFGTAIRTAMSTDVSSVSFYAFHTLTPQEWEALKGVWRML